MEMYCDSVRCVALEKKPERAFFFFLLLFVSRLSFKFLKYLCSAVRSPFIAVKH